LLIGIEIGNIYPQSTYNDIGLLKSRLIYSFDELDNLGYLFKEYFNGDDLIIAKAVVFPEIFRYNATEDLIQSFSNSALKSIGSDYSIGKFQMKPSFIEMVLNRTKNNLGFKISLSEYDKIEIQITILHMFINDCYNEIQGLVYLGCEDKIKIISAAYTYGYIGSIYALHILGDNKTWISRFQMYNTKYRYRDIALLYYNYAKGNNK